MDSEGKPLLATGTDSPSHWTPDLLYLHVTARMNAETRMLDERYESQKKAMETALTAAEKAVDAALAAQEKAVMVANAANEKRFENVNEFRAQLGDIQRTLISRTEAESRFTSLDEKMNTRFMTMDDAIKRIQSTIDRGFTAADGRQEGARDTQAATRSNIALLVAGAGLLITLAVMILNNTASIAGQ